MLIGWGPHRGRLPSVRPGRHACATFNHATAMRLCESLCASMSFLALKGRSAMCRTLLRNSTNVRQDNSLETSHFEERNPKVPLRFMFHYCNTS